MMLSPPVLAVVRREMRRLTPCVRFDMDQIRSVLVNEVLKQDVMEGDKADDARKKIARISGRSLRSAGAKKELSEGLKHVEVNKNIDANQVALLEPLDCVPSLSTTLLSVMAVPVNDIHPLRTTA